MHAHSTRIDFDVGAHVGRDLSRAKMLHCAESWGVKLCAQRIIKGGTVEFADRHVENEPEPFAR